MKSLFPSALALAAAIVAPAATAAAAAATGPLSLTSRVMVERRVAAADGTTRIELAAPTRVVPGDGVQVVLAYRNTGQTPIADLVLANPVPAGMAFAGALGEGAGPELSVDGTRFAALPALRVAAAGGGSRAAIAADVTHVRWRLARPLAPGASGSLAFRAVVK